MKDNLSFYVRTYLNDWVKLKKMKGGGKREKSKRVKESKRVIEEDQASPSIITHSLSLPLLMMSAAITNIIFIFQ